MLTVGSNWPEPYWIQLTPCHAWEAAIQFDDLTSSNRHYRSFHNRPTMDPESSSASCLFR